MSLILLPRFLVDLRLLFLNSVGMHSEWTALRTFCKILYRALCASSLLCTGRRPSLPDKAGHDI